jgi:isopentenyldiphosphate isomerase
LVLFNSKDEMLIHKRALTHRLYPGLYTYAVSGFVDNESYLQSIKRETQEELGISPSFRKLFVYYFANDYDNAFHAVFSSKTDEELSIDRSEIESIKATSFDALKEDMIKHKEKYTPPFLRGMEILFSKSRFLPR